MLIEFYGVIVTIVPIIGFCLLFSGIMKERYKDEITLSKTVYEYFFNGECVDAKCSDSEIKVKSLDVVKIRAAQKPFKIKDQEEKKDEALSSLYRELEKAIEDNPNK